MSDEQTQLLQQILDVQKETLAFAKQQNEQFLALQNKALAGQRKGLSMSRFVIAFMVIMVGSIVVLSSLAPRVVENPPAIEPVRDHPAAPER